MRTTDFEKAIDALGVQGLEVKKFSYGNSQVAAVYAQMGENKYLMWDASGRGFIYDVDPDAEIRTIEKFPEYLDYRRDAEFDLTFE